MKYISNNYFKWK